MTHYAEEKVVRGCVPVFILVGVQLQVDKLVITFLIGDVRFHLRQTM